MKHSFVTQGLSVFDDLQAIAEDETVEYKKAAGKSGKGEIPKDFFESYSAMANTNGGAIILGVQEADNKFYIVGIEEPERVVKELFDLLNNPQKVNINLLSSQRVVIHEVKRVGKRVIIVSVPRASRTQKPVFVGQNPYTGTYRRNFEGDYLCPRDIVEKIIAEKVTESHDAKLLTNYHIDDLEQSSLRTYRNNFKSKWPDHPWNDEDDIGFLERLGGYRRDRDSKQEGLSLAGLLMFGKGHIIQDVVPNYFLDYQEREDDNIENRWIDRISIDGTWSGNLYDFYRRVIQKLYADLKVPFKLSGSQRVDDTPVHEALREALVNALIHADYSDRVSILVIKRPDMFIFQNPGLLRIPLDEAKRGGNSDCRNKNLQKMFFMVGFSDRAGTGIPKIFKNWTDQHWHPPLILERIDPDETIVQLKMVSLIPDSAIQELDERFGEQFRKLPELQILALATVVSKGFVTHSLLKPMTKEHSREVTTALAALVRDGRLVDGGKGRNKYYFFPDNPPPFHTSEPETLKVGSDTDMDFIYEFLTPLELPDLPSELPSLVAKLPDLQPKLPDLDVLPEEAGLSPELWKFTESARNTRKLAKSEMEYLLLSLCDTAWMSPIELGKYLDRDVETLRPHIQRLVNTNDLEGKYPGTPKHPGQAYKTTGEGVLRIKNLKKPEK